MTMEVNFKSKISNFGNLKWNIETPNTYNNLLRLETMDKRQ